MKKLAAALLLAAVPALAQLNAPERVKAVIPPIKVSTISIGVLVYVVEADGGVYTCSSSPGVKPYVLIEINSVKTGPPNFVEAGMRYVAPNALMRSDGTVHYTLSCLRF